MRQLFLDKGLIAVKEVSKPLLDEYSVLVQVHYSCISSGTEIATINQSKKNIFFGNMPQTVKKVLDSVAVNGLDGTSALIKEKLKGEVQTLGYSCSGVVVAIGSKVKKIRAGDLVACAGAGAAHHADMVCVPENLVVKVHKKESLRNASATTIGAIALQGVRRANVQLGESVCVLGLGLLGQLTVQLLKRAGCRVAGTDLLPERLALARSLGADLALHATEHDVVKEIAFWTDQQGVDVTIVAAASPKDYLVQQAMEITRKKGRVVVVGDVGLGLKRAPLYQKEIDFLISCSYGPGRYDAEYEQRGHDYPYAYVRWTENRNMTAIVAMIEQGQLAIDQLVHAEVNLEDVAKAYASLQSQKGLGIIISYGHGEPVKLVPDQPAPQAMPLAEKEIEFIPARRDALRVGIVGAGGFAKVKLMPMLARIKNASITAIVDANVTTAITMSRHYGVARVLADDRELFNEDLVDVVVIASPHKYHCDQVMRALDQGKAVFVEKPLVTDFEQLTRLHAMLDAHPNAPLCVDYNRAFAPCIQKIKEAIAERKTPLIIHYRMNAGYIPKEHWVQTDIGAGRIIGEACHIIDLFYYLTDARPVSVSVESLNTGTDTLFPTDNFVASISFSDGSICSLLYTSLGHKKLGKERMELFFDSKSIIMDDYMYLAGFGMRSSFDESGMTADKGHEALLNTFFERIKKPTFEPPIPFARLRAVSELTLIIDELACEGGGDRELQ